MYFVIPIRAPILNNKTQLSLQFSLNSIILKHVISTTLAKKQKNQKPKPHQSYRKHLARASSAQRPAPRAQPLQLACTPAAPVTSSPSISAAPAATIFGLTSCNLRQQLKSLTAITTAAPAARNPPHASTQITSLHHACIDTRVIQNQQVSIQKSKF